MDLTSNFRLLDLVLILAFDVPHIHVVVAGVLRYNFEVVVVVFIV